MQATGYASNRLCKQQAMQATGYVSNTLCKQQAMQATGYASNRLCKQHAMQATGYASNTLCKQQATCKHAMQATGYASNRLCKQHAMQATTGDLDPTWACHLDHNIVQPCLDHKSHKAVPSALATHASRPTLCTLPWSQVTRQSQAH